jgi:hypothetical protein
MQVQSVIDVDQPLFQPFPPEVVFHTYEPFKEYEAVLRLRNNDKVGGYLWQLVWSCMLESCTCRLPACHLLL